MKNKIAKNKKGMTLVETIVAIGIFVIGIEGFALLFLKNWEINKFVIEEGEASLKASQGVQRTVDVIRKARQADTGAYLIDSANDNDLIIYSDYDNDGDTERIHYFLDGQDFKRGIADPQGAPVSYPVGDQMVNVVVDHVTNDVSVPIFSYYNRDYPADITNNPLTTPVGNINEVTLIKVHLVVNIDPVHAPNNINFQSLARLRNLNE